MLVYGVHDCILLRTVNNVLSHARTCDTLLTEIRKITEGVWKGVPGGAASHFDVAANGIIASRALVF